MSQEKYIYLIYQQIQGVLTPSDEGLLQKWLEDSPENRKTQEEIIQSMTLMEDYKPSFSIDEAGDYTKIRKELGLSGPIKQEGKKIGLPNRRRWIGIAATLVLLVSAALFFLNTPEPELEWTLISSTDQKVNEVALPDGSIAFLNKNSKIEFPKEFLGKNRPIKMQGEVFFQVKRDEKKPFQIFARNSKISVLGTEFNVRDYADEATTVVTVSSGKVAFSDIKDAQRVVLTANEAAEMDVNAELITKQEAANPNAFSYQSGELIFNNIPLTKVFKDLSRHYKVNIDCQNQALVKCKYSLTKQVIELDSLLNNLKTLYRIEVVKDSKDGYIVSGGGC